MNYREVSLTSDVKEILLKMSADWTVENSCRGYYANDESDVRESLFLGDE